MQDLKEIPESVEDRPTRRVAQVGLRDFRNYDSLTVGLASGFNVLSGANAQGKTNFLEALYFLSTTRLLRGQRDGEAIREGCQHMHVSAILSGSETEVALSLERGSRKKALLNGLGLPRAADLIGRLPCVCISAADMEIVRGEPSERRLFLDLELSSLFPAYLRHFATYKRALEQRNALLRDSRERLHPPESFEVWEDQLALHGAAIRETRRSYLAELHPLSQEVHAQMGQGEVFGVAYVERDPAASYEALLGELAGSRGMDIARGGTSVGPHRDDLEILVDGREARLYGSQGQQRTAVIALKMATLVLSTSRLGDPPLLLLDDILSDLDADRRALLVEVVLSKAGQAVLTCTEASAAGEAILSQAKLFEVRAGTIKEA